MPDYRSIFGEIFFRENMPMSEYTSFRIGGNAEVLVEPASVGELLRCLSIAKELDKKVIIIGNGTNMLVSDEGIEGICIRIAERMSAAEINGTRINVQAGARIASIAKKSVLNGLMGLEWAAGIPGTVGGAIAMNAGAYYGEMSMVLKKVSGIMDGGFCSFDVKDDDMGYRKSRFIAPDFLTCEAEIELIPDDGSALSRMNDYNARRREKQPLSYPSAGSTFKRPEGYFAGALIEQAGLKGTSIGGAMVSTKHAGFIINTGNATCSDVLALIELVQKRVYDMSGVMLETEVKYIGKR